MNKIIDKYYKSTEKILYSYKMLKVSIDNLESEIVELKKESGMGAINYDTQKTSPTFKINKNTEDQAIKNITEIDLKEKLIEVTTNKISRIERALDALNDKEKTIVEMRYFEGKQWFEIAYKIQYSERHCKRIRSNTIKKLAIGIYGERAVA
ncbi:MAG: hypothetical protein FH761_17800 [Firmicutes bacterium]|nr:hypothetical protein [Bacillota bacterium]